MIGGEPRCSDLKTVMGLASGGNDEHSDEQACQYCLVNTALCLGTRCKVCLDFPHTGSAGIPGTSVNITPYTGPMGPAFNCPNCWNISGGEWRLESVIVSLSLMYIIFPYFLSSGMAVPRHIISQYITLPHAIAFSWVTVLMEHSHFSNSVESIKAYLYAPAIFHWQTFSERSVWPSIHKRIIVLTLLSSVSVESLVIKAKSHH